MLTKSRQVVATQQRRPALKAATLQLFIFLSCVITAAHGQEFRASISGIVTDPTGAAVAGAKVEATDVQRKVTLTKTTNEVGRYSIEFLIPSTYILTVTANGFKTYNHEKFSLGINDRVGIDVTMQLGAVTDSVTVSGQVSPLQTETANRGGIVPYEVVQNLPNNGQNAFNLVFLMPGAQRPNYSQNTNFGLAGSQGGSMFSINGSAGGGRAGVPGTTTS
jgi:Carboxypeptidase regulatory-like domain